MDKLITSIPGRPATYAASSPFKVSRSVSFNDVLEGFIDKAEPQQIATASPEKVMLAGEISPRRHTVSELLMQHKELKTSADEKMSGSNPPSMVQLGVISERVPTVSHLLKANSSLATNTWNILSSAANRNKDFTHLPLGTVVEFDPVTKEISWQSHRQTRPEVRAMVDPADAEGVTSVAGVAADAVGMQPLSSGVKQPLSLGMIDQANNTVSHLLTSHPILRKQVWEILFSSVNQDKPFHRIAKGTEIFIQPDTNEITWNTADVTTPAAMQSDTGAVGGLHHSAAESAPEVPAFDLSEAVRPFFGTPYKEIDCYELLVKGLNRMDIPYKGKNGLYTKLTGMARDNGMPVNAYLNGEGIVKAAGTLLLSNKYPDMANWKQDAEKLIREMEPMLDKGQILSFSTESRGHTGIVSQQDNQWTFINSGRLDNSLASNSLHRGVGEEILDKEIRNWFKLAHARKETLAVTLGRLEQSEVRTAYNLPDSLTKQI